MTITSLNPHDPGDVVGEWEPTDGHGVDAAVARARRASDGWRSVPAGELAPDRPCHQEYATT